MNKFEMRNSLGVMATILCLLVVTPLQTYAAEPEATKVTAADPEGIAAADAKLELLKEEAAKGPVMVRIPGKNYEMGKYEVTQKEWRDIMGNNPSKFTMSFPRKIVFQR